MFHKDKSHKKRLIPLVLGIIAILLLSALCGAFILFQDELKIIGTIRREPGEKPIYFMETESDYHFEKFLESGGASSDKEVAAFLTKYISKGFYSLDLEESELACSLLSAMNTDGTHIWGRNFDWSGSVPIIVKCSPKNGYASIATCDFMNITNDAHALPDNLANKMLAISALYVPMDGINEAGLCVADLEVNEGGMMNVDTDKPDLTITTATRLILNKAATVNEAVDLLQQYDIHASGGISHHLAVSDAEGTSVVLEFVDGKMVVVPSNCATNFNLANGDSAAGGASSKERYELLNSIYEENNGILTPQQMKDAISQVSKKEGEWTTQWSIVYNHSTLDVSYWFYGDYNTVYSYSLSK